MFGLGLPELIVIFFVILMLFGSKALPDIARGLAQAIKTFKNEAREIKEDLDIDQTLKASESVRKASESQWKKVNDFNDDLNRRDWRPKPNNDSASKKG